MLRLSPTAEEATKGPEPSCLRCYHFHVCAIAKAFIPLMANSFSEDPPIDAPDLAKICRSYVASTGVLTQ